MKFNLYFKICSLIVYFVLLIGVVLPYLFSAKSDIAFIIGIIVSFFGAYGLYYMLRNIINQIKNLKS
jgi:hypothetical protein